MKMVENEVCYISIHESSKVTRKIIFVFIAFVLFSLNSCYLKTMDALRKEIIKKNPRVTSVGIILDWTNSDDKFIALELKLEDYKILFFTLVNYRKLPSREPFYLRRVGNYVFASIYVFENKQTNRRTIELMTDERGYSLPELSARTGIQITTMSDLLKYYDDIEVYIASLPTVNETNYQEMVKAKEFIEDTIGENEQNFITTYLVKIIWNDEYYGYEWKDGKEHERRPDYDNNEVFGGLYFWGI